MKRLLLVVVALLFAFVCMFVPTVIFPLDLVLADCGAEPDQRSRVLLGLQQPGDELDLIRHERKRRW